MGALDITARRAGRPDRGPTATCATAAQTAAARESRGGILPNLWTGLRQEVTMKRHLQRGNLWKGRHAQEPLGAARPLVGAAAQQ